MSKKLIITLSTVFICIAVVLILFWTLFSLSSVSVQFHSTTKNLTITNEEIVEAGQFRYGACVFFEGKNKSIDSINKKSKENPNFAYLKVLNIETVFPNKFIIHVAERAELFSVETDGQVLICDSELRVLKIGETENDTIHVSGLNIINEDVKVGDFLDVEQTFMKRFYGVMLQNNRDLSQQLGKFEKIKLEKYKDSITQKEYHSMMLTTSNNRKFVINNPEFAFVNKIQKMFATESTLFSQDVDNDGHILDKDKKPIYVKLSDSNEYLPCLSEDDGAVALTYSLLSKCYIKVDNLTLDEHINRTEQDIYYSICPLN